MNFIENETRQKLRGGYYTPIDLADFLVRWVKAIDPRSILEPSCGDGVFFRAAAAAGGLDRARFVGFELDAEEARKAQRSARAGKLHATVRTDDFLAWSLARLRDGGPRCDAVLGNPPFVRYQYLPAAFQARAERVFERLDCRFTRHTNAWVPFVLASMALLRPGGRLAMVVPAEIIHVMHAGSLRAYLGAQCRRIVIVDPEELWFGDTLQGAVMLLAEKGASDGDARDGLAIVSVKGREFVGRDPDEVFTAPRCVSGKSVEGKWTRALLDRSTRDLLDELARHPQIHRFTDVADVDVGIVTGANKYFLVTDEVVARYGLGAWAHPMFGRSGHCPGIIYDERQHRANARNGNPTNFLWFGDQSAERDRSARKYIRAGEAQRLHARYKCRVRAPWYSVPSVYATDIGMLKRSHDTPRLILNALGAFTTDTAYRIRSKRVAARRLVACFVNPLTALSAELEGRHYGGGVLELVPSEIERLWIPLPSRARVDLTALDQVVRTRPAADVLEQHGGVVLRGLGLRPAQQAQLLGAWMRLRNRRHRTSGEGR